MLTRGVMLGAVLLVGCEGVSTQTFPSVFIEAHVLQRCDAGCDDPPVQFHSPMCGYDVSAFDAGVMRCDGSGPAAKVTGVYELDTTLLTAGTSVPLPARRGLFSGRSQVYGAIVSSTPLYAIGGGAIFVPTDGGEARVTEGSFTFSYPRDLPDGGHTVIEETHDVVTGTVDVQYHDHGNDPFYGCCGHAGWATPTAAGLALVALTFLRRRARSD